MFVGLPARSLVPLPLLALVLGACGAKSAGVPALETASVERKTLTVSASANGTVEPIRIVEVKSRASGEVIEMPVSTGMVVPKGALLAQIDRRDASTTLEQAEADLAAAEARLVVASSARKRSDALFADGLVTAEAHDAAVYEHASAEAAAVKTRSNVVNARERLGDTTVRAPSAGTILSKTVEVGQIIASAVSQVSGGTVLLTMADLVRVQVRALVDEADVGILAPGQSATVEVEAHPGRKFVGTVVKIEPQAVASQSVTLFPVLIELDNALGLLMPGMNADIEVLVEERANVLVLPKETLKSSREAPVVARYLGIADGAGDTAGGGAEAAAAERGRGDSARGGRAGARDASAGANGGGAGAGAGGRDASMVVFVRTGDASYAMRPVTTGLQNWREVEIVEGVSEGDEVAIPPSGQFLTGQSEMRDRMRRMSGLPGMQRQTR
jgi:HlyD family secretion protein